MCFGCFSLCERKQAAHCELRLTDERLKHAQGARSLLLYDAVDEPVALLGQALKLPVQCEPRRKEIEAVLPALSA
jgi:hypothetical protein